MKTMKTAIAVAVIYLASLAATPATILFFEDLSVGAMPTNYNGLLWSGWLTVNPFSPPTTNSGYPNAVVSPYKVVGNIDGRFTTVSNSGAFPFFTLNSAYLTAALNDGLQVEVQGFSGNTMTYDHTYTLMTTGPTLLNFNYAGVNAIKFISSGGTLHPGYPDQGVHYFNFAMDNFSFTIPEPGTASLWSLMATAAGLYVLKTKRRQGG